MSPEMSDQVRVKEYHRNSAGELVDLHIRLEGKDRPNIIADVARKLEGERLYISSVAFNLILPYQDQYEMEVVTKGDPLGLENIDHLIRSGRFFHAPHYLRGGQIFWSEAYLFHLALLTIDSSGLTARISDIVGKSRHVGEGICPSGSFVHMLGITYNSRGAWDAAPYFRLLANVATQTLDVQSQIVDDLRDWALKKGISDDLWIHDLNRPTQNHSAI